MHLSFGSILVWSSLIKPSLARSSLALSLLLPMGLKPLVSAFEGIGIEGAKRELNVVEMSAITSTLTAPAAQSTLHLGAMPLGMVQLDMAQLGIAHLGPPLEVMQLGAQLLLGGGAVLAGGALAWGASRYTRQQKWQRIEFLRRTVKAFEQDPEIRNALKILDFEEYRDYTVPAQPSSDLDQFITFRVENDLLCCALAEHDARARRKHRLNYQEDHDSLEPDALRQYQIETALRDWFNKMLNGLEHFSYFLESGLFSEAELWPWLSYWIKLIADPAYRRPGASKFYDALYSYIHSSGFLGVQKLFERYDYKILPSPYKDTDLIAVLPSRSSDKGESPYSTRLALTLAKASYLAYQDKQFVAEVVGRWCSPVSRQSPREIIRNNFRYFNNHGRDTQAFMFRTDELMVLAFRGSQEPRDWLTNFATQLQNFTVYKNGEATISSDRGRVHKGFFLAWSIIEKSVFSQISRWQQDFDRAEKSPPPLYVTGHSLGGALATIAAAALADHGLDVAGVYTFGQPRVGDRAFVRRLNSSTQGKVFRFVNNNDIVPHVPPPFSIWNPTRFYGHVGGATYFNRRGIITPNANHSLGDRAIDLVLGIAQGLIGKGFDHITDHRMEYYISHLDSALKKEIEAQAAKLLESDSLAANRANSLSFNNSELSRTETNALRSETLDTAQADTLNSDESKPDSLAA